MTEQDFILLVEQHLDNSIAEDGRRALRRELAADPERQRRFELQARQHVRLHAQTSRCDFTDSQRVAAMVVDIVQKTREPRVYDYLHTPPLRERIRAVFRGLRAPAGSGLRRHAQDVLGRIVGAPAISLAINLAVIGLLVYFAIPRTDERTDSGAGVICLAPPPPTPPTLDPRQPAPTQPTETPGAPDGLETPSAPVISEPTTPSEPASGLPGPVIETTFPSIPLMPTITAGTGAKSTSLPTPLRGRPKGQRHELLVKGDGEDTEDAVTRALLWLKQHQRDDGSWDGQDKAAMTGLALLAFLGRNETTQSPEFGTTVRKGLDYLLHVQDAQGRFSPNVYAHAIGAYAVSEAYTLTRVILLRDAMERAVAVIVAGQQPDGGFDYDYAKAARFDTSVTGWQVQALKAARLAGSDHPGLEQALNQCVVFLKNESYARDGSGFVYSGTPGLQAFGGATPSMTAVGTLCLQLLGQGHAPQTRAGLKALENSVCEWPAAKVRVYATYYVTQAKFQQENNAVWRKWNQQFKTTLLRHQQKDGHWEGGDYDQGSHVYTTALCALTLEVYYRVLPTYTKAPPVETVTSISTGAVPVEVQ